MPLSVLSQTVLSTVQPLLSATNANSQPVVSNETSSSRRIMGAKVSSQHQQQRGQQKSASSAANSIRRNTSASNNETAYNSHPQQYQPIYANYPQNTIVPPLPGSSSSGTSRGPFISNTLVRAHPHHSAPHHYSSNGLTALPHHYTMQPPPPLPPSATMMGSTYNGYPAPVPPQLMAPPPPPSSHRYLAGASALAPVGSTISRYLPATSNNVVYNGYSNGTYGRQTMPVTANAKQRSSFVTATRSHNQQATSAICRCRVMYLGSAVPHVTKDGLQGIQEPLKDLYPDYQSLMMGNAGIDSWLSVWSNGILLENIDECGREIKRFYPIESLHYCAAVRYFLQSTTTAIGNSTAQAAGQEEPNKQQQQQSAAAAAAGSQGDNSDNSTDTELSTSAAQQTTNNQKVKIGQRIVRFLPLDSPSLLMQQQHLYAHNNNNNNNNINAVAMSGQPLVNNGAVHPPVFACIMRRTTGIKVLECHAFICKRDAAANALVRCCFHAYADTMFAKQMMEQQKQEQQQLDNDDENDNPTNQTDSLSDLEEDATADKNNNNNGDKCMTSVRQGSNDPLDSSASIDEDGRSSSLSYLSGGGGGVGQRSLAIEQWRHHSGANNKHKHKQEQIANMTGEGTKNGSSHKQQQQQQQQQQRADRRGGIDNMMNRSMSSHEVNHVRDNQHVKLVENDYNNYMLGNNGDRSRRRASGGTNLVEQQQQHQRELMQLYESQRASSELRHSKSLHQLHYYHGHAPSVDHHHSQQQQQQQQQHRKQQLLRGNINKRSSQSCFDLPLNGFNTNTDEDLKQNGRQDLPFGDLTNKLLTQERRQSQSSSVATGDTVQTNNNYQTINTNNGGGLYETNPKEQQQQQQFRPSASKGTSQRSNPIKHQHQHQHHGQQQLQVKNKQQQGTIKSVVSVTDSVTMMRMHHPSKQTRLSNHQQMADFYNTIAATGAPTLLSANNSKLLAADLYSTTRPHNPHFSNGPMSPYHGYHHQAPPPALMYAQYPYPYHHHAAAAAAAADIHQQPIYASNLGTIRRPTGAQGHMMMPGHGGHLQLAPAFHQPIATLSRNNQQQAIYSPGIVHQVQHRSHDDLLANLACQQQYQLDHQQLLTSSGGNTMTKKKSTSSGRLGSATTVLECKNKKGDKKMKQVVAGAPTVAPTNGTKHNHSPSSGNDTSSNEAIFPIVSGPPGFLTATLKGRKKKALVEAPTIATATTNTTTTTSLLPSVGGNEMKLLPPNGYSSSTMTKHPKIPFVAQSNTPLAYVSLMRHQPNSSLGKAAAQQQLIKPSSKAELLLEASAKKRQKQLAEKQQKFLQSKEGKKWLKKQQKELVTMLPPQLEGMPIVFGPPPVDDEPIYVPINGHHRIRQSGNGSKLLPDNSLAPVKMHNNNSSSTTTTTTNGHERHNMQIEGADSLSNSQPKDNSRPKADSLDSETKKTTTTAATIELQQQSENEPTNNHDESQQKTTVSQLANDTQHNVLDNAKNDAYNDDNENEQIVATNEEDNQSSSSIITNGSVSSGLPEPPSTFESSSSRTNSQASMQDYNANQSDEAIHG